MATTRRGKQSNGERLTSVDGCGPTSSDELVELRTQLAELRTQLAAAGAPEEVLRALDTHDAEEALQNLVEAGMLPSPEEALAGLLAGWEPLCKPGTDTFKAELSGAEFLSTMREAAPDSDEVPEILAGLIGHAEDTAKPEALAMLRVLAVLGPPEIQLSAAEAADRLVAAGLTDRPWVRELGTPPQVGPCFGFVDEFGAQEGITVTFTYGRKVHAFVVLIDHGLGGGVKDCYPTDRPDKIRAEYQKVAKRHVLDYHDYTPATARAILDRALAAPPCPVAPDQVEDVGNYLDLLRRRMALLPDSTVAPLVKPGAAGTRRAPITTMRTVYKVKITLRGAKPPIWRRLEVPSGITLEQLHHTIQEAFGWMGCHLWVFSTPIGDYGLADPELGHRSAASTKLDNVAGRAGDRLRYTYDFGDDWEHEILVEDVLSAEPGVAYPRCVAGRRACPPEDCGGIWGYEELCEILADPGHPEHAERLDWLGLESAEQFNPAQLNLDEVNGALSGMARVLLKG